MPIWESLFSHWQIRAAVHRLGHQDASVRFRAEEQLRASGQACWPLLRHIAFLDRTSQAVTCAELLHTFGDPQGLYALLEQNANAHMAASYGTQLRSALREIGPAPVLATLGSALEKLTPELSAGHWSLPLAVYALNGLKLLNAPPPYDVWRRALRAYIPHFENLSTVRAAHPPLTSLLGTDESSPSLDTWPLNGSIAGIRRVTADVLLALERNVAYDLFADALTAHSPHVHLTAFYGFCRLRDPRALVLLQPFAANKRHPLWREARQAIETFGGDKPEVLTLVRASQAETQAPAELLRAVGSPTHDAPETLLRPSE